MKIEMFVIYGDDKNYLDFQDKGWRDDIIVKINDEYFNLNIYTLESFVFDMNLTIKNHGTYIMDPNIIIVEKMDYQSILKNIIDNYQNDYFNNIKPCKINKNKLNLIVNKKTLMAYNNAYISTCFDASDLIKVLEYTVI